MHRDAHADVHLFSRRHGPPSVSQAGRRARQVHDVQGARQGVGGGRAGGARLRAFTPNDVNLGDDTPRTMLVEPGDISKSTMFTPRVRAAFKLINWAVRIIGFTLCIGVGIYLLLKPVAELISFLPLLDGILKHAFAIFALIAAIVLTPVFIALGWVYARPLAASAVFAVVGGIALAAQGGFATSGAIVSVSIFWGIAAIELLYGAWMAFSDYQHREEMRKQIEELEKEGREPT